MLVRIVTWLLYVTARHIGHGFLTFCHSFGRVNLTLSTKHLSSVVFSNPPLRLRKRRLQLGENLCTSRGMTWYDIIVSQVSPSPILGRSLLKIFWSLRRDNRGFGAGTLPALAPWQADTQMTETRVERTWAYCMLEYSGLFGSHSWINGLFDAICACSLVLSCLRRTWIRCFLGMWR